MDLKHTSELHAAVRAGDAEGAKLAIAAGAEVDGRGEVGETALMWTVGNANRDCVRLLLDAGADVNAKDFFGMTPAMWATRFGSRDPWFIEALVAAGADLRATDAMRRTAATHAKIGGLAEISALIKARLASVDERKRLVNSVGSKPGKEKPRSLRM